ncbi:uncharacterized protein LOC124776146, partial [Schistocerca piceifrons]|uniref:uncharacterized protein LOC124776146 n=1 Tax=Schistocerca piceifrons TaxID=274613 RepID=UPI001F5EB006
MCKCNDSSRLQEFIMIIRELQVNTAPRGGSKQSVDTLNKYDLLINAISVNEKHQICRQTFVLM